jgi:peroxiredoxin 2/4
MCDDQILQIGQPAPGFKATAVMGDNSFKELSLSDYKGKYVYLFFYPLDFTFVCPTEILAFNKRLEDFKKRGVEVLGVSIDSQFSHLAWKNTSVDEGGIGNIQYPLIADVTKDISYKYYVLLEEAGIALRGSFLIDKEGILKQYTVNDLPLGRSIDEALRVIDALQYTEKNGEVCPADWKQGEDAMAATQDGVSSYLAKKHG